MISQTPDVRTTPRWKRIIVVSASAGGGFALVLALIVGGALWYSSQPKPPRPWNTKAMHVSQPPSFDSTDGKSISLGYDIANTTEMDYTIESADDMRIMSRFKDGSLKGPIPEDTVKLTLPLFIPAGRTSEASLVIFDQGTPSRATGESGKDFHERLRTFLLEKAPDFAGFSIFDARSRYQIDFPRWLSAGGHPAKETDPLGLYRPYDPALAECLKQIDIKDSLGLFTDDPVKATRRQACINRFREKSK